MLLVIELRKEDIDKWCIMDVDVRKLLTEFRLDNPHGVCVRYYEFDKDAKVEKVRSRPAQVSEAVSSSFTRTPPEVIRERRLRLNERINADLVERRPLLEPTPAMPPVAVQQGTQTSSGAGSRSPTPIEERVIVQLFPRDERPEWLSNWAFR